MVIVSDTYLLYSTQCMDNSAPGTLFPYNTMVQRAVETGLSDNIDMLQLDTGNGEAADDSLPGEVM